MVLIQNIWKLFCMTGIRPRSKAYKAYKTSKRKKAASSSDRDLRKLQITLMIFIEAQLCLPQIAFESDFVWGTISPKSRRIHADHDQSKVEENRPLDTGRPTFVMHSTSINFFYKCTCLYSWKNRDAQKRKTVGVLPPPPPPPHRAVCMCTVQYGTYCVNAVCCCTVCGWCSMTDGAVYI